MDKESTNLKLCILREELALLHDFIKKADSKSSYHISLGSKALQSNMLWWMCVCLFDPDIQCVCYIHSLILIKDMWWKLNKIQKTR